MTQANVTSWSTTAASNVDLNDIVITNNNMVPGDVDNAFREMMAQIKSALTADTMNVTFGTVNGTTATFSNLDGILGANTPAAITGTTLGLSGDITFSNADPEILGGDTNGYLHVGAGATNILGGYIDFYGDTHATRAGDIRFGANGSDRFYWDESATTFNISTNSLVAGATTLSGNLNFTQANPEINGGDTDGVFYIAVGASAGTGPNIRLFGASHATLANDMGFFVGGSGSLYYDDSASMWDCGTNNLKWTRSGHVSAADGDLTPSVAALNGQDGVLNFGAYTAIATVTTIDDAVAGQMITLINTGPYTITYTRANSFLNGTTNQTLAYRESFSLVFDGANWHQVAAKTSNG